MLGRIVRFIAWGISGLFGFVGFVGLFSPQPLVALLFLLWAALFLPPLWSLTRRYGTAKNLWGRVAACLIGTIAIANALPPASQAPRTVAPSPIASVSPLPSPSASPSISPAPPEANLQVQESPRVEASPSPVSKADAQESPSPAPAPATINPDAPVRAAVSGSCDCPYDSDRRGRSCGARSAYSRPGGSRPICYERDRQ